MIKNLLISWKESVSIFLPSNAKLFFLVFLKTLLSTYKNVLLYGWWAFLLTLLATSYLVFYPLVLFTYVNPIWTAFIWFFIAFLSARPSVKLKTWGYYKDYWIHGIFLLLMALLLQWAMALLFTGALYIAQCTPAFMGYGITLALTPLALFFFLSFDIFLLLISPWFLFFALFVCDSLPSFKRFFVSGWRASIMVFYNYPWCVIIYFGFRYLLGFLVMGLHALAVPFLIINAIMLLLLPIPVVMVTCFYTKRLHDQFNYYFPATNRA